MTRKAMIHLICGPIGAGKTTFAQRLAEQHEAIRFSEDEWLSTLFVPDAPSDLLQAPMETIAAWAAHKFGHCRMQIWSVCEQLLRRDVPVVIDGAAANRDQRDTIRHKALQAAVEFKLYYVTADRQVRWARIQDRNKAHGSTYSIEVTPQMFARMEDFFEAPVGDELRGVETIYT